MIEVYKPCFVERIKNFRVLSTYNTLALIDNHYYLLKLKR